MRLPDLVAYQAAVQHPSTAFADPQLRAASVTPGQFGLPRAVAGNFAVTYQLRAGGRQWAVRCFHREAADRRTRYAAISQTLAHVKVDGPLVPIEYLDAGVRVGSAWYPITKMPWLEGRPLNRAVEDSLSRPRALADIERRFVETVRELRRLGIAHGDLQHGNVLVDGAGTLRLVDYDGMFVPGLHGRAASESGDPNYQHPRRTTQFDAELDRFAAIVIVLAVRALAVAPRLWHTFNTGDNLLFQRADFANPTASPLFHELMGVPSIRELSERFARVCQGEYASVPTLDQFLNPARPMLSTRHVAMLNALFSSPPRPATSAAATPARRTRAPHAAPRSWKLRRTSVQVVVAFSADGQLLATSDAAGRIIVRESATGRTRRAMRLPRGAGTVQALAFTPTAEVLAATSSGPRVGIWEVSRQRLRHDWSVSGGAVRGVALSSNAAWLVAASDAGTVHCWKVGSGSAAATLQRRALVTLLAVSGDGRWVAVAGPRLPVTIVQNAGGEPVVLPLASRGVACLAFARDGSRLLMGTLSGRLSVWHLRGGAHEQDVAALSSPLTAVALAPDSTALAATGGDGSIWLRRLPASRAARGRQRVASLSATRVIASSYKLFDWLRRVAL